MERGLDGEGLRRKGVERIIAYVSKARPGKNSASHFILSTPNNLLTLPSSLHHLFSQQRQTVICYLVATSLPNIEADFMYHQVSPSHPCCVIMSG
jgi:siroheme synthase